MSVERPINTEQALAHIADFTERMGWTMPEPHADDALMSLPVESEGRCDDCSEEARTRVRLGQVTVCNGCALSRLRAGFRIAADTAARDRAA